MDTAFPGLWAWLRNSFPCWFIAVHRDTRPRPYRAASSRISEARWWPRHTLITQDHHDAREAVTAFQLSSMEWRRIRAYLLVFASNRRIWRRV